MPKLALLKCSQISKIAMFPWLLLFQEHFLFTEIEDPFTIQVPRSWLNWLGAGAPRAAGVGASGVSTHHTGGGGAPPPPATERAPVGAESGGGGGGGDEAVKETAGGPEH